MIEGNWTSTKEFIISPFFMNSMYMSLCVPILFNLFFFGVLINSMIIMLVYTSSRLHTPMYVFLCNLSVVDICYTTFTVPKFLYMCISENNAISYNECFIQMFFYLLVGSTEDIIILTMALDRYVAICNPLHYHRILNKKTCFLLVIGCWVLGSYNSCLITFEASKFIFCNSVTLHQFFCDGKALIDIVCSVSNLFHVVIYTELFIFGFFPLVFSSISYIKIMKVILKIKSTEGRKKSFSTCSSHLTVVFMYFTFASSVYLMPKYLDIPQQISSVVYTVVTPMINPLIYSLRNNDVKLALHELIGVKCLKKWH